MKKKFLTICIATILTLSLTSCSLKDAITGQISNEDNSEDIVDNSDNNIDTEGDIINELTNEDETTDESLEASNELITEDSNTLNASSDLETSTSNNSDSSAAVSSNTVKRDCRIFYFNSADLKTYYTDSTVSVTDNAFVTALTNKLYTSPNDNLMVLPKEYGVSSATLDYETNILKVTFNEDFTQKMTLGSATESGLINAIVNTYGYNYGVDKVAIYFGDTLYTGLKGDLPEGYFTVNFSDASSIK